MELQFIEYAKYWPYLAADHDLWGQIQGRHCIRSNRLPLTRHFLCTSQQFVAFTQSCHILATDHDLDHWGKSQGCHLLRSVKLPQIAPLLSCTRQIINITKFWFVLWPWPFETNSRSLIWGNPWVVKNQHAKNCVKILKIGGVVRARTDRQTDRQTDWKTDRQTH